MNCGFDPKLPVSLWRSISLNTAAEINLKLLCNTYVIALANDAPFVAPRCARQGRPDCWPPDEILVAYYKVEGSCRFGSHRNSHVLSGFT